MENTYIKETNIETPKRFNRSTREHKVCQDCALGRWPHRNCSVGCMMAFDIKFLQNLSHLFADHFHLGLKSCSSCFLDFFCRSRALKCFRGQTSAQGCWKGRTQRCKGRLEKTVFKRSCKISGQQCRVLHPERSWPIPTSGLQQ